MFVFLIDKPVKVLEKSKTKEHNKKKKTKLQEKEEHHRSSTSLPDGWTKVISNGKKYYANRKTQESSWKPPVGSTGGSSGNN